jgi:DNA-directed RNA polymerase subunit RPC12/RpoP
MSQSHTSYPNKGPQQQPPCPKCGYPMWLARIEPTDKSDYDQRTFECPQCDHSETMMVKFN